MKTKHKEVLTESEIFSFLKSHKDILEKKYNLRKIGLFGSFARGEQKEGSDIDFIVEFRRPDFDNFMELAFYLEEAFGRKVELITNGNISPYLKPYVDKEVKWYEG